MVSIYFAGKVGKKGWRDVLLGDRSMSRGSFTLPTEYCAAYYAGPFALGCDHGCYHQDGSHGLSAPGACQSLDDEILPKHMVVRRCLSQVENAHLVVAYLEDLTAYGTLAEIGYASACEVTVALWIAPKLQSAPDELWFVKRLPWVRFMGYSFPDLEMALRLKK
jgi:hypothetical protein